MDANRVAVHGSTPGSAVVAQVTTQGFDWSGLKFHTAGTQSKNSSSYVRPLADSTGDFPFEAVFARPEFIFVNSNIHPWMKGIFAVMKNSHDAITAGEGEFKLPNLPPGNSTITAWHESHGEHIQEVTIAGNEATIMNFVSKA